MRWDVEMCNTQQQTEEPRGMPCLSVTVHYVWTQMKTMKTPSLQLVMKEKKMSSMKETCANNASFAP